MFQSCASGTMGFPGRVSLCEESCVQVPVSIPAAVQVGAVVSIQFW